MYHKNKWEGCFFLQALFDDDVDDNNNNKCKLWMMNLEINIIFKKIAT